MNVKNLPFTCYQASKTLSDEWSPDDPQIRHKMLKAYGNSLKQFWVHSYKERGTEIPLPVHPARIVRHKIAWVIPAPSCNKNNIPYIPDTYMLLVLYNTSHIKCTVHNAPYKHVYITYNITLLGIAEPIPCMLNNGA